VELLDAAFGSTSRHLPFAIIRPVYMPFTSVSNFSASFWLFAYIYQVSNTSDLLTKNMESTSATAFTSLPRKTKNQ
jgi:hypothetical protein